VAILKIAEAYHPRGSLLGVGNKLKTKVIFRFI